MELRSRLVMELKRLGNGNVLELPPDGLAEAVCRVLDQPGAGIVMLHRLLRLPVAAAGPSVPEAEQLQVTLGQGPCLSAMAAGVPLAFTEAELVERWPIYHVGLRARTPYRSTVSFPLRRADGLTFAALDVYSDQPKPTLALPLDEVAAEVGEIVAMLLLGALAEEDQPLVWPPTPDLRRRQQVWVAVGMVLEAAGVDDVDALAILRGYAFRHDLLLDDVAARMLDGSLTTESVLDVP